MRRNAIWHATVLVAWLAASVAQSQTASSWVGRKVVTKYPQALKVGNQIVDDGSEFHVFTVERVNGDWLWLVSGGARGWMRSGNVVPFDQAVDFYTQEIHLKPSSALAYHLRGIIWKQKGEYDIAIADYNEAIRLDPRFVPAHISRGNAWSDKKEYDRAIADFNEAIRIEPKLAIVYANRGNAWLRKKEYDRAIADYDEAIRIDPKLAMAYGKRGQRLGMQEGLRPGDRRLQRVHPHRPEGCDGV